MIAPAPTLSICAAIFIWAASPSLIDPDSAEEQTIQCDDVPAAVRSAFKKMLPEATVRSCVREEEMGKSAYEVTSTDGEITRDVLFDANGALLVVEEAIAATALPKAVAQSWEKRFPNHTIVLAEKVMRHNDVTYEIQSTHLGKLLETVFDSNGKELTGLISLPR
jgi:Putative beta-lactamase-inhibitor-like, PepSY-like